GCRFGGILPAITVYLIEVLSLRVVRFQVVIADRPSRRYSAVVTQSAEVLFAQAEQRCPIELGIAADVIVGVRMKFLAVFVEPGFFGVVMRVYVYDLRVPVCLLAGDVVAALQNQDPFPRRRQVVSERPAAGAGSNDDYVVSVVIHVANPPFAPQKM